MENLLQSCLGDRFELLPPLVRQAHIGDTQLEGSVAVYRGNLLAKLICNIFGMPPAKERCHLVIHGYHSADTMLWNRRFDQHQMNSHFYKKGNNLVEKLGPIHMELTLKVDSNRLIYRLHKTRILGIPIPKSFSPNVIAIEEQYQDHYRFSVNVAMPLIGKLVSYSGDMVAHP